MEFLTAWALSCGHRGTNTKVYSTMESDMGRESELTKTAACIQAVMKMTSQVARASTLGRMESVMMEPGKMVSSTEKA